MLTKDDGSRIDWDWAREKMKTAQRRAGMEADGKLHKLRHTFGSLLAMRNATAKAIQELMGHADLTTTMRYLHLTPEHKVEASRLLEHGDVVETGAPVSLTGNVGQEKPRQMDEIWRGKMVTPTGIEPMFSA